MQQELFFHPYAYYLNGTSNNIKRDFPFNPEELIHSSYNLFPSYHLKIAETDSYRTTKSSKKYQIISDEVRNELIYTLENNKEKMKQAAKRLQINYSSAKSIYQIYKREGRCNKKMTRKRVANKKKKKDLKEFGKKKAKNVSDEAEYYDDSSVYHNVLEKRLDSPFAKKDDEEEGLSQEPTKRQCIPNDSPLLKTEDECASPLTEMMYRNRSTSNDQTSSGSIHSDPLTEFKEARTPIVAIKSTYQDYNPNQHHEGLVPLKVHIMCRYVILPGLLYTLIRTLTLTMCLETSTIN